VVTFLGSEGLRLGLRAALVADEACTVVPSLEMWGSEPGAKRRKGCDGALVLVAMLTVQAKALTWIELCI
jgi:hypothetical protein